MYTEATMGLHDLRLRDHVRHTDHFGYKPNRTENILITHPIGTLQVTVSRFCSGDQSEDQAASNISVTLIPSQKFWFARKILQLRYLEVQNQCKLPDPKPSFKIICVRPLDSHIFSAVHCSDLTMVRSLLASGQASIYDQDEDGWGLLRVNASLSYAIFEFLQINCYRRQLRLVALMW